MDNYWFYLLKVSIIFSILYCTYWIFFRKNTFHNLNRILLLVIMISSAIIPLLEFNSTEYFAKTTSKVFEIGSFNEIIVLNIPTDVSTTEKTFSAWKILSFIYLIGLIFFLLKASIQLIRIFNLYKQHKKIINGVNKIIITPKHLPPFSFFNWIFLPEDEYSSADMHPIIEHERIHAKQWHSIDLLLTELFCICLWFVPFVYSFKNSIKSVHEYLADKKVAKDAHTTIDYLKLLAANTEKYTLIGLSNNFYCSTLKNRITMITKNRSSKLASIKYLLLLPAFVLLIQTFACNSETELQENSSTIDQSSAIEKDPSFIEPISSTNYEISAKYENMYNPITKKNIFHKGFDLKAKTGTEIIAAAEGKIVKVRPSDEGYGNLIAIEHENNMLTLYAHLSEFKVAVGDIVKQGDIIGLVGNTGMSTGPHLHFEIRKDGEKVNPADYIDFK
ncbi:MAG: peptidoglycan DD-metalloendopeptidase family protein [Salinivirgaceae bacterium]|nr:peptidoglycan DD-metalloendopeptidase family protein [Salinivirgaceae bacterium]